MTRSEPPRTLLPPVITKHLDAIRALCREYGVARIDVFGSAVTPSFDPTRSDIDFLVDYAPETDLGPWLKRHFELQRRLTSLLGHPVDLTMAGGLRNRYVIQAINETRHLLYAA
ncbi:MAG: nucleotidyltransferase domain-containing protein [Chloroflexota bacterium]|nr:nucleotidyltransferase domain-containing protein [Chloroflexota bacterium]